MRGKIHCKTTTGAIYTGPSLAKLSIGNNAFLFQDKMVKVLSTTDGGVWALTPHRSNLTGLSHHRPSLDRMTPLPWDCCRRSKGIIWGRTMKCCKTK